MAVRDLIDQVREKFVNANTAPTRSIVYIRSRDDLEIPLNSFVGAGTFNKIEKDKIDDYQSFGGLKLEEVPVSSVSGDKVTYDGVTYQVRRVAKLGQLYTVYGEKVRHRGRP